MPRPTKYATPEEAAAARREKQRASKARRLAKFAENAPPCECGGPDVNGCGRRTSGKPGVRFAHGHKPRTLLSEEERRARHREIARRSRERLRAEAPRRQSRKASDPYYPPAYCAAEGCNKRLTVAAVAGESEHCSRLCAGFGETTDFGGEPTDAELAAVL